MDDIKQILQMMMGDPAIRQMVRSLLEGALGRPGAGLDYLSYDTRKTVEYNIDQQRRFDTIQRYLTSGQAAAYDNILKTATNNVMRMWGYEDGGAPGGIADIAGKLLVAPQVRAAANAMAQGFYSRSTQWDPNAWNTAAGDKASEYLNIANDVMQQTLETAANRGFGGMAMADVGRLVGEYARLGGYDGILVSGQSGRERRLNAIQNELQKYAQSINMMRDVIDGPMEKIMESFEKLTGSKLVSTATGRATSIASAMRNVLAQGLISEQGLANLTATQYGLIAPMGGSLMQATAMSLASAAAMNYGVRIEGLSDIQLGNALAKDNARMVANGDLRSIAAAYVHWRGAREDTAELKDQFIREIGNGKDLAAAAREYLTGKNISGEFMGSALVTNTMADASFIATARMGYAKQYEKVRDAVIAREAGADSKNASAIDAVLKSTYDISQIQDRLMAAGVNANTAARIANEMGTQARLITGAESWETAMGMIGTGMGAVNTLQRNLAGDAFRRIQGQVRPGGFAGIMAAMLDKGNEASLASMARAWLGVPDINPGNRDEVVAKLAQSFGMSKEELGEMFDTAAGLGGIGETVLFAQRGFVKGPDGRVTRQLSADEANVKRARLLKMMKTGGNPDDDAGIDGPEGEMAYSTIRAMAEGIELSDADIDRIYLKTTRGMEASAQDAVDFAKYRGEYAKTAKTPDEAAKRAAAKLSAKKLVEQKRAELRSRGEAVDNEAVDNEAVVKAVANSEKFKEVAKDAAQDATELARGLTQQDGLMGILNDILTAIGRLVPGAQSGSTSNR